MMHMLWVFLKKVLYSGIRQHWDDQAYEDGIAIRSSIEDLKGARQLSNFAERRMYQVGT